jgi:hypothetical protein
MAVKSSLDEQRADRPRHRHGGGSRFVASLGASVVIGFGVGAPLAVAQSPARVSAHRGGDATGGSDGVDQSLRGLLGPLVQPLVAAPLEHNQPVHAQSSPPQRRPPSTTTLTSVPTQPVATMVPTPIAVPNTPGAAPIAEIGGAGATLAAPRTAVVSRSTGGSTANGEAPAAAPPSPAPPATAPRRGAVARALGTAGSDGALLALVAAVVVFLLVQGRVDRRDPRILSAPVEDHLDFRDFE